MYYIQMRDENNYIKMLCVTELSSSKSTLLWGNITQTCHML